MPDPANDLRIDSMLPDLPIFTCISSTSMVNANIQHEEVSTRMITAELKSSDAVKSTSQVIPAIAQLVEHLTVECCSNQMVPGSIPGGRILLCLPRLSNEHRAAC